MDQMWAIGTSWEGSMDWLGRRACFRLLCDSIVQLLATFRSILLTHFSLSLFPGVAIHIVLRWNVKAKGKEETKDVDHCETVQNIISIDRLRQTQTSIVTEWVKAALCNRDGQVQVREAVNTNTHCPQIDSVRYVATPG